MNFDQAIKQFRRYLQITNYKENTISSYCKTIERFLANKNLETLNQNDLDDIAVELMGKYQNNGNRLRFSAINCFCEHILHRGKNHEDKDKRLYLKISKSECKNKDIITNEQVKKILEIAKTKNTTAYTVLLTIYHCALRKSEAYNLNLEDVDFENQEISLKDTKTGDEVVSMSLIVSDALRQYIYYERKPSMTNEKALFLNKFGKRIGENYIRKHLKKYAVEAGITKRVYPHMLRASCITHLLNNRSNPFAVQQHARHKNFSTTMIYNRPTQQEIRKDIERVFTVKTDLTNEERTRMAFDKYMQGELSKEEFLYATECFQPKQLKPKSEFMGYA